jgi:glycosyltransferase involved in cell wall biosynthesis
MLPYGLSIQTIPRVAFVLDAVSLYFRRNLKSEKNLSKKISYFNEFVKMRMYEKRIYNRFERCVVVSKIDKIALQRHCSGAKISVMPVGVDTEYFNATPEREDFPSLLFSGNMDFPPNVHAVLWFVKKVWPDVKKSCPNIKLYIAGRNPSTALNHLRNDSQIIITGFVEDIRPYFDRATIYVCPMVSGAGMKDKLLEAMAMRKAIVASPLSIQGIPDVEEKKCVVIAKDNDEFAGSIIKLLKSPAYREGLESNARNFVKENYSWKNSTKILEQVYEQAIYEFKKNRGKKH